MSHTLKDAAHAAQMAAEASQLPQPGFLLLQVKTRIEAAARQGLTRLADPLQGLLLAPSEEVKQEVWSELENLGFRVLVGNSDADIVIGWGPLDGEK